ncbi:uncharacterized protein LOC141928323 isoform X1 [Strix aluco]|uniref:uncharacterized protein LOC141928323 isoform X1 n=1 Tax=Strix aluco TaxID=111821 RepID=UPI003DA44BCB
MATPQLAESTITVEGQTLFYRQAEPAGQAPKLTVLLLHGIRFSSDTWLQLQTLATLAENGYRAVAIDLPAQPPAQGVCACGAHLHREIHSGAVRPDQNPHPDRVWGQGHGAGAGQPEQPAAPPRAPGAGAAGRRTRLLPGQAQRVAPRAPGLPAAAGVSRTDRVEGPTGQGDVASPPTPPPVHTPLRQPSCSSGPHPALPHCARPTPAPPPPLGPNKTPSSATAFLHLPPAPFHPSRLLPRSPPPWPPSRVFGG